MVLRGRLRGRVGRRRTFFREGRPLGAAFVVVLPMRKDDRHVDRPTEATQRRFSIGGIAFPWTALVGVAIIATWRQ